MLPVSLFEYPILVNYFFLIRGEEEEVTCMLDVF